MSRKFTPSRARLRTSRMRSQLNQQKSRNLSRVNHSQKIKDQCPEIKE